jgi:outer membrane protein TolC
MNRPSHIRTLAAALVLLAGPVRSQESILEAYVREGLRNNESVQQQGFLLNKQEYALKEATRMFFPDVALQGMYTRADGGRKMKSFNAFVAA